VLANLAFSRPEHESVPGVSEMLQGRNPDALLLSPVCPHLFTLARARSRGYRSTPPARAGTLTE